MLLYAYNLRDKIKKYIEPSDILQQKDGSYLDPRFGRIRQIP